MGIAETMRRLSEGVRRGFAPQVAEGGATYHLRVRVTGALNTTSGQRAVTETDYDVSGACVPFAIDQNFSQSAQGTKRPTEERVLCIPRATLVTAGMDLDLKGPNISSALIENKNTQTERLLEIVESDLINGGTMFRIRTKQARFGNVV